MATATWNGTVIARSDATVTVEGNHDFPMNSVTTGLLEPTDDSTSCPWKGQASYFDIVVAGDRNTNAAWTHAAPNDVAAEIRDHVAFYPSVTVTA